MRKCLREMQALLWEQNCREKKNKKGKQGIIKTQGTLRIGIQDIHLSSSAWVEGKPRQTLQGFLFPFKKLRRHLCVGCALSASFPSPGSDPAHLIMRLSEFKGMALRYPLVVWRKALIAVFSGSSCNGTFQGGWHVQSCLPEVLLNWV